MFKATLAAAMLLSTSAIASVKIVTIPSRVTCGSVSDVTKFIDEQFSPTGIAFQGKNKIGADVIIFSLDNGSWVEMKSIDGSACVFDIGAGAESTGM